MCQLLCACLLLSLHVINAGLKAGVIAVASLFTDSCGSSTLLMILSCLARPVNMTGWLYPFCVVLFITAIQLSKSYRAAHMHSRPGIFGLRVLPVPVALVLAPLHALSTSIGNLPVSAAGTWWQWERVRMQALQEVFAEPDARITWSQLAQMTGISQFQACAAVCQLGLLQRGAALDGAKGLVVQAAELHRCALQRFPLPSAHFNFYGARCRLDNSTCTCQQLALLRICSWLDPATLPALEMQNQSSGHQSVPWLTIDELFHYQSHISQNAGVKVLFDADELTSIDQKWSRLVILWDLTSSHISQADR